MSADPIPAISAPTQDRLPLAERAYRALRDRIIRLDLSPGSVLSEEALAKELGIGRTPVRDAVRRLTHEGLVVILPRRGTLVSEINVHHPLQVAEVRNALEPLAARLAAERLTEADRGDLRRLRLELQDVKPGADFDELLELDSRVHRMVFRLTKNPLLQETLEMYYNLASRVWFALHERMPASLIEEIERHDQLLAAISRGDADEAERNSRTHVTLSTGYPF